MSWSKTSPTSATRPLAPRERFMTLVAQSAMPPGGEQHVIFSNCLFPAELTSERLIQLIPQFKAAWLALRFEHPSIASTLSTDCSSMSYTSPTSKQLQDEWLKQTFIIDESATTTHELRTRLRERASNSLTLAIRARAILLAQSHWKTDGRAVFMLGGRYLALSNEPLSKLGNLEWGTELERLVPSLAHIAGLSPEPPPHPTPELDQDAMDFLKVGAPKGQKLVAAPDAPCGDPRTEHILLSEEETKKIIEASRRRGFGFGSAVHAAAALYNLSIVDPSWSQKEYKYNVHRDLRGRLPAPWNGIASAAGEMVSSSVGAIPANSNFMTAALAMEKHGKEGFTDAKFALDEAMWTRILQILASVKPEDMDVPLDTIISSLGIVDRYFDNSKDIMAESVEMGGQGYTAMAGGWFYTYRGRLNMTISYNVGYRSPDSMQTYLTTVRAILERELL